MKYIAILGIVLGLGYLGIPPSDTGPITSELDVGTSNIAAVDIGKALDNPAISVISGAAVNLEPGKEVYVLAPASVEIVGDIAVKEKAIRASDGSLMICDSNSGIAYDYGPGTKDRAAPGFALTDDSAVTPVDLKVPHDYGPGAKDLDSFAYYSYGDDAGTGLLI